MDRMIDQIRNSRVASNVMKFAARGSLALPPGETIEILVYLALHNKIFGEQARLTLAGWDEKSSVAAAADPKTNMEVLGYLVSPENLRPSLLPALAENPAVEEESLDHLASTGSRSVIEVLLVSPRVRSSRRLLQALQSNLRLSSKESAEIERQLAALEGNSGGVETVSEPEPIQAESEGNSPAFETTMPVDVPEPDAAAEEVVETTFAKYLQENATELAVERDKPFQPIGLSAEEINDETSGRAERQAISRVDETAAGNEIAASRDEKSATPGKPVAAGAIKGKKSALSPNEARRDSPLQRISKLDIRGRISLAMRGNKEDRSILIRDSTKLVAIAVLESPKITDGEVEAFALQKNVLESVLRTIPMKRRFAKNYNIIRNLVQNPRTPLDLSLGLMKGLMLRDLKNLSGNKEVADTIRKVATRMYKQKLEKKD